MQVSDPNNVKIYNLSAGKSLPEWLSERKRRALLKKNIDIRRRIELIQDFDMPGLSTNVKVSKDGNYIIATGTYKPRVKCFDVNNLSLKFERCYDADAVAFEILSDDYSKLVFLQCDRYIEFHYAAGRYYRLRIPKFGRDIKYQPSTCDLIICGIGPDIYRLNLERGQFLTPYTGTASAVNRMAINPQNQLIVCGTQEGKIEAWDWRSKSIVGTLDVAFNVAVESKEVQTSAVTSLNFSGGLQMAVGTSTGQVLLYDIRSNKPFLVKDHMYGFPIKDVEFHTRQDYVYSMDKSVVKIWDKNNGKLFTSVEGQYDNNNLCVVPGTGLMFIANENTKIQTHYIPSLGPAPKWASFLDSLTEELEETNTEIVYDDYKFVTKAELENLGLDHLIGSNLLRAYMHGYFVDIRLYKKAKSVANPFEFEEYRKKKVREIIEKDRVNRVQVNKLPQVNKDLALKLMGEQMDPKKRKKTKGNLLQDERFKGLFENADFQVDKNAEEYRMLNPVLSRLDKNKKKELEKKILNGEFEAMDDEELEGKNSSDESDDFDEFEDDNDDDSSDDDQAWTKEVKKEHRLIQKEKRAKEREETKVKMFELRQGEEFKGVQHMKRKANKTSLGERLGSEVSNVRMVGSIGNREMTFATGKRKRDRNIEEKNRRHHEERKQLMRPTFGMKSKKNMFRR